MKSISVFLATTMLLAACGGGGKNSTPESQVKELRIVETTPVTDAKNSPIDTPIIIRFNQPLAASSTAASLFTLYDGNVPISGSLDVNDDTMTFTPDQDLEYSRTYQATAMGRIASSTQQTLGSPHKWSFTTRDVADTTAPTIVKRYPASGATDVPVNHAISITFSEKMDTTTFAGLVLSDGDGNQISIDKLINANTLIVRPKRELQAAAEYKFSLSGAFDIAGNAFEDTAWFFQTGATRDETPPLVDTDSLDPPWPGADPQALTLGRSTNSRVLVGFSEPVLATDLGSTNFYLEEEGSGEKVPAEIGYDGERAALRPLSKLKNSTIYVVRLQEIRDLAGLPIADFSYRFQTRAKDTTPPRIESTSLPLDTTQRIALDVVIRITFSEALDPNSVRDHTIRLNPIVDAESKYPDAQPIYGESTVDDSLVTFVPASPLLDETTYELIIDTHITDEEGNALQSPYSQEFLTADITPPQFVTIVPADGAEDVVKNANVTVTFNEPLAATQSTNAIVLNNGGAVPGSIVVNGNDLIFETSSDLGEFSQYNVTVSGVSDAHGNVMPAESSFTTTFRTGDAEVPELFVGTATPTQTPPGLRPEISIRASEVIDVDSLTESSFYVRNETTSETVPGARSVDGDRIIFKPDADLDDQTSYRVFLTVAITDLTGKALQSGFDWTFTTDDFTAPTITGHSLTQTDNIDPNNLGEIEIFFDEILDPATIDATDFNLSPSGNIDGAVAGAQQNSVVLTLSGLADSVDYTLSLASPIADDSGNAINLNTYSYSLDFATGDYTAPSITSAVPANGASNINKSNITSIALKADEALDPTSVVIDNFSLINFSATVALDGDNRTIRFTPTTALADGTTYSIVPASTVTDLNGNGVNAYSYSFTTGDFTGPLVTGTSLPQTTNLNPGTLTQIELFFDEALDLTGLDTTFFDLSPNGSIDSAVAGAADTSIILSLSGLVDNTNYTLDLTTPLTDASGNGNTLDSYSLAFGTGDYTAPSITSAVPANGASNVNKVNITVITLKADEDLDPTSVILDNFTLTNLSGLVSGVSLDVDNRTLRFALSATLSDGVTYGIAPTSGLTDLNGNGVNSYNYSFTTGDFTAPSVTSTSLGAQTTNLNPGTLTQIELFFGEALNLSTLAAADFTLSPSGSITNAVAGAGDSSIIVSLSGLADSTDYTLELATPLADTSGNGNVLNSYTLNFGTGDFTPPTTTQSRSPTPGQSGLPQNTTIFITFSEAIRSDSVNANTFILFEAGTANTVDGTRKTTDSVITFTPLADLKSLTDYEIVLTTGIKDLAGNTLAAEERWTFKTLDYVAPEATINLPAGATENNVSTNPTWSVTFSEAVKLAGGSSPFTLSGGSGGDIIPESDYTPGNLVSQINFSLPAESLLEEKTQYTFNVDNSQIADGAEIPLSAVAPANFTVGDFSGPVVNTITPNEASRNNINRLSPGNFSVVFNETIVVPDLLTVASIDKGSINAVFDGNRTLTLTPSGLQDQQTYIVTLNAGKIQDASLNNNNFVGQSFNFSTGDFTAPSVTSTSIDAQTSDLDPSALTQIELFFDEALSLGALSATDFTLAPSGSITATVAGAGDSSIVLSLSGLVDSTNYTLDLVTPLADASGNGNTLDSYSLNFGTGDYTAPNIISAVPANGASNVNGTNVTEITLKADEDLEVTSVILTNFTLTNLSGLVSGVSLDADNRTVRFALSGSLSDGVTYGIAPTTDMTDLNGNGVNSYSYSFTTGDFTAPSVTGTSLPQATNLNPNTLTQIELFFDEALDLAALDASFFSLSPSGTIDSAVAGAGNTSIVVAISGLADSIDYSLDLAKPVSDTSGNNNTLNSYTLAFATGDYTAPQIILTTPVNGDDKVNKDDVTTITLSADEALASATIVSGNFTLTGLQASVEPGVDGKSMVFTPTAPLTENTSYTIEFGAAVTDTSGNGFAPYSYTFTTADFSPPVVTGFAPVNLVDAAATTTATVTFSDQMSDFSAVANAFTLRQAGVALTTPLGVSGDTLTANLPALTDNTRYVARVSAAAATNQNGIAMESDHVWSFTTGSLVDVNLADLPVITDINSTALYVLSGLKPATEYLTILRSANTDLGLELFADAFLTSSCSSKTAKAANACLATTNAAGELYVRVSGVIATTGITLDVQEAVAAVAAPIAAGGHHVVSDGTLVNGSDYLAQMTPVGGNVDLFVQQSGEVVCSADNTGEAPDACEFASNGTNARLILLNQNGAGTVSYSHNIDPLRTPAAGESLTGGNKAYYKYTGAAGDYHVALSNMSQALSLTVMGDNPTGAACTPVVPDASASYCAATTAGDKLYFVADATAIGGATTVTFDAVVTALLSSNATSVATTGSVSGSTATYRVATGSAAVSYNLFTTGLSLGSVTVSGSGDGINYPCALGANDANCVVTSDANGDIYVHAAGSGSYTFELLKSGNFSSLTATDLTASPSVSFATNETEAYYQITGLLTDGTGYILSLDTKGMDLGLRGYGDAFNTLLASCSYSGIEPGRIYCFVTPTTDGNLFVQVDTLTTTSNTFDLFVSEAPVIDELAGLVPDPAAKSSATQTVATGASRHYRITGLSAAQDYEISASAMSKNVDIAFYADPFFTPIGNPTANTGVQNDYGVAAANVQGNEIFLKVTDVSGAAVDVKYQVNVSLPPADINLTVGTQNGTSGSVGWSEQALVASGLNPTTDYLVQIRDLTYTAGLTVYEDGTKASNLCPTVSEANNARYCYSQTTSNGMYLVVDGTGTANGASFNLDIMDVTPFGAATDGDAAPDWSAQTVSAGGVNFYRVTGLTADAQQITLSAITAGDANLEVYADPHMATLLCASTLSASVDSCTATPVITGELFIKVTGDAGAGFDLDVAAYTATAQALPLTALAIAQGETQFIQISGVGANKTLTLTPGTAEDLDIYVYSDAFNTLSVAGTTVDTNGETVTLTTSTDVLYLLIDASKAGAATTYSVAASTAP